MILSLLEKFADALCRICESNYLLDWITRVGMSEEGHLLMTIQEKEKPVKKFWSKVKRLARGS